MNDVQYVDQQGVQVTICDPVITKMSPKLTCFDNSHPWREWYYYDRKEGAIWVKDKVVKWVNERLGK